jgi:hypothetical protein
MKKIIIAFDGDNFSEGAFEFARRLNELQPILLTGVFVPEAELAGLWGYTGGVGNLAVPLIERNDPEGNQESISKFQKRCLDNGIDFRIHQDDNDFALNELKQETTFADLLLLGSEMFYRGLGINSPNDYLEGALHNVKCPIIVVPEEFDFPEGLILAYDGSENSVFAIKQFAYLFPELTAKPTVLVYASSDSQRDFPDKILIEELTARHYSDLSMYRMDVNPGNYLNAWIVGKESVMLVCGAYGRSGLSQLFKKSFVSEIIASHSLPVFIDHR